MEDTTLIGIPLNPSFTTMMRYLKFTIESNSNKQLDVFTKALVVAIRNAGAVKAGPIPSKGKRLVYSYNTDPRVIDSIMRRVKPNKKVMFNVELLERPQ